MESFFSGIPTPTMGPPPPNAELLLLGPGPFVPVGLVLMPLFENPEPLFGDPKPLPDEPMPELPIPLDPFEPLFEKPKPELPPLLGLFAEPFPTPFADPFGDPLAA